MAKATRSDRATRLLALVLACAAFLSGISMASGVDPADWCFRREVIVKVAEVTGRPVPCLWLMVYDPSETKHLGRYDRRSDSMGVARMGFPGPGKWVIRCKGPGYRDTSAVLVIEESPTDTLRVAIRATGG